MLLESNAQFSDKYVKGLINGLKTRLTNDLTTQRCGLDHISVMEKRGWSHRPRPGRHCPHIRWSKTHSPSRHPWTITNHPKDSAWRASNTTLRLVTSRDPQPQEPHIALKQRDPHARIANTMHPATSDPRLSPSNFFNQHHHYIHPHPSPTSPKSRHFPSPKSRTPTSPKSRTPRTNTHIHPTQNPDDVCCETISKM